VEVLKPRLLAAEVLLTRDRRVMFLEKKPRLHVLAQGSRRKLQQCQHARSSGIRKLDRMLRTMYEGKALVSAITSSVHGMEHPLTDGGPPYLCNQKHHPEAEQNVFRNVSSCTTRLGTNTALVVDLIYRY
jgi:ribosomal protein L21E